LVLFIIVSVVKSVSNVGIDLSSVLVIEISVCSKIIYFPWAKKYLINNFNLLFRDNIISVVDWACSAVAFSYKTELVDSFDVLKSVRKISKTVWNTVHIAFISLVLDNLNCCSFPSFFSYGLLDSISFHHFFVSS
jgi:hypothetical protein